MVTLSHSVTVGGHFLSAGSLRRTMAVSLRLGRLRQERDDEGNELSAATNASHNAAVMVLIDRLWLSRILPFAEAITKYATSGKYDKDLRSAVKVWQESDGNMDLLLAVLLGDTVFDPSLDPETDHIPLAVKQHKAVYRWAVHWGRLMSAAGHSEIWTSLVNIGKDILKMTKAEDSDFNHAGWVHELLDDAWANPK